MYLIQGTTDDGEAFELKFMLPQAVPSRPSFIYLYAIRALWDARWTPGSVSWQVYSLSPMGFDSVALDIGETIS